MDIIQSTASEVLINLALGVITLLGAYGVYFIQKAAAKVQTQTARIKDESSRKLLNNSLADVKNLASVTVGSVRKRLTRSRQQSRRKHRRSSPTTSAASTTTSRN